MSNASLILRGAVMACALCTASLPALASNHASHTKAPARWFTGDNTPQQRKAILKKEISAAYAEQQSACRKHASSERNACLRDARQTYQSDMARVPQLLASAPTGEVSERVVSTTTTPATGGTTSYGGSAGGATGSGGGQDNMGNQPAQPSQQK